MGIERTKAIYVGPDSLGKVVVSELKNIDFVAQVSKIDDLWKGLEDRTIDNDVPIIITTDLLYSEDDNIEFEQLVASMSNHCFFAILSYRPELEKEIRKSISIQSKVQGVEDKQEYYFIDKNSYKKSIKHSLKEYVSTTNNKEYTKVLTEYLNEIDNFQSNAILSAANNYSETLTLVENENEIIFLNISYNPDTLEIVHQFINKRKDND